MLNTTEILSIAFLRVFMEQVNETKESVLNEPWISHLISKAKAYIRYAELEIVLSGLRREEDSEEFYKLTGILKDKLSPVDFLFYKALFADSEQESLFLLQQAQMMAPENLRLHIIVYFMSGSFDDIPDLFFQHMDSLSTKNTYPAVDKYIFILKLIRSLEQKDGALDVHKIAEFLNGGGLPKRVMFSILYLIMMRADVSITRSILDNLNIYEQEQNSTYILMNAYVYSELKAYDTALHWFSKIKLEGLMLPLEIQLSLRYRLCQALMNTGNEGKAILMLREIIYSGIYDACGCDDYYHAIVDLALYYNQSRQTEEAGRVLSILDLTGIEYLEELRGEEFLILMAEAHMQKDRWEDALDWYRKAFKMTGNKEVGDIIKSLEAGL
jgi:tetratricopeptide (TPR) repeat protein